MTRDYKIYLKDILGAITSIDAFIKDMTFEEFEADDKTVSAVVRKFEVIGEATKQIPGEIRNKYPSLPWKEMAGMRDKLIHFYFGVDNKLIWETIKNKLPVVKGQINQIPNNFNL